MTLSLKQQMLCERLEKGAGTAAAVLIRQQAYEIDDLWDRVSRAYALVRHECPADMVQEEMEQLRAMLDERLAKSEVSEEQGRGRLEGMAKFDEVPNPA